VCHLFLLTLRRARMTNVVVERGLMEEAVVFDGLMALNLSWPL